VRLNLKLILGFLIIVLVIGIFGCFNIFANQQIAESYSDLKGYEEIVDAATEASSYAKRAEGHLFLYLMFENETDRGKFFNRHASLEEQIVIIERNATIQEVIDQVNILRSFSDKIIDFGNQLIQLHDENPVTFNLKDNEELLLDLHDSSSGARRAGVSIVDLETSALNQDIEQSINNADIFQRIAIFILALAIIFALITSFLTAQSISRPIKRLRDVAVEIGKGKIGAKIDIRTKDEIGDLSDAFNTMSSRLRESYEHLEEKVEERTRELKDAHKQLIKNERFAAIGEAITMVGHDMRNPLQAIKNATFCINNELSRLPSSKSSSLNMSEMLQVINNSVDYANDIVMDLKDFSTRREPIFLKCDINSLVKETLEHVATSKNLEVITELSCLSEISVDQEMIKRVFLNLTVNGMQAMENGGRLTISTKSEDSFIEVGFKDTGIGMSKENLEKLFTPFFTTKAKGMGIGLSICKKFVEAHNGIIEIESTEGKGTEVLIKLPISQQNGGEAYPGK
jgi:signal transduction histidine kinase